MANLDLSEIENKKNNYVMAFRKYKAILEAQKEYNLHKIANDVADIFDIVPAFFFYADDFGLNRAIDYWLRQAEMEEEAVSTLTNMVRDAFHEEKKFN